MDVRREIEQSLELEAVSGLQQSIESACASIRASVEERLETQKLDFPSILIDEGKRDPYRELDESKGPLNQIRIRISDQDKTKHVDLRDRSKVVRAIDPFKFNRMYVADDESEQFLQGLIKKEIENVQKACA